MLRKAIPRLYTDSIIGFVEIIKVAIVTVSNLFKYDPLLTLNVTFHITEGIFTLMTVSLRKGYPVRMHSFLKAMPTGSGFC